MDGWTEWVTYCYCYNNVHHFLLTRILLRVYEVASQGLLQKIQACKCRAAFLSPQKDSCVLLIKINLYNAFVYCVKFSMGPVHNLLFFSELFVLRLHIGWRSPRGGFTAAIYNGKYMISYWSKSLRTGMKDKVKLRLPGNKGGYDLEGEDSLETGLRLTGRLVRSWSRGQGRLRWGRV